MGRENELYASDHARFAMCCASNSEMVLIACAEIAVNHGQSVHSIVDKDHAKFDSSWVGNAVIIRRAEADIASKRGRCP